MNDKLIIKGAKENNLKDINIELPRNKLIVFTGLSGSGKSSLAFDTIYAEGQRRYVESLSAYARQFLGLMEKPDVESIEGLSPAISIDQKTTSKNPRSTVGTVTEIYDYLRLLYARIGIPHCPSCGKKIKMQTIDQIVDQIMEMKEGTRISVMAPIIRGKKGEHVKIFENAVKDGYIRARVDGHIYDLSEEIPMIDKQKKHNIEVLVDRLVIKQDIRKRLADSVELALKQANNLVVISVVDGEDIYFSQNYACVDCNISLEELTPRMFSFNTPFGACPSCTGLGNLLKIDPELIIPDKTKSLSDPTAIKGWGSSKQDSITLMYLKGLSEHYKVDINTKIEKLPKDFYNILLYGSKGEKIHFHHESKTFSRDFKCEFEGVVYILERRFRETTSKVMKDYYETLMTNTDCKECNGARLKKESLAVKVGKYNIHQLTSLSVKDIKDYANNLNLNEKEKNISYQIMKELNARLQFLIDVGLEYLTLSRTAGTLSGGEAQRIRLATQIGSGLTGVLYILDEPSIGLHQRDNKKLLNSLKKMRDLGNTLIVVEHDEDTMREADYIVDIGPGAGVHGGEVIFAGTPEQLLKDENSITGKYLSGRMKIEVPKKRREITDKKIEIIKAEENNLKKINVEIPLGVFTCITGVSGSGKSSLVNEILYKAVAKSLNNTRGKVGKHKEIKGIENIDKIINIDQSPIGRTPRSNPATYTGMFDHIRDLFSQTNEAKLRGYQKGRFSFNVPGGRCEACSGDGIIKIEMHFLPDVYVSCDVCKGKRYSKETLEVKFKGKNISEILNLTVEEALEFFKNVAKIKNRLQTLYDVGLGYIKIGQPSTTLSGGEAQRVKLATELSKRNTGNTMYILDEPTTGLHSADVHNLIRIINRLTDGGNTLVMIEHNLDMIKSADYIIDLGQEGGNNGGKVIATGRPEEIAKIKESYTGNFLKPILAKN
ncbi:MAG: excinuclease ABC subunit UvrA [Clostridia bacterium]|nr:excinuclease ABC subunit UvrA [Clostridia bacterium]MDD4375417.1 excinuclease ABC subunit UvrA [Clostridia bacterium]